MNPGPALVLVRGPEELLAERAVTATLAELKHQAPDLETIRIAAQAYQPGELTTHTSPSLFGGAKAVVVERLDEAPDDRPAPRPARMEIGAARWT